MDSGTMLRQLPSPPSAGILAGRARKVLESLVLGLKSGPHGNEYMVLLSIRFQGGPGARASTSPGGTWAGILP